jgi:hypothetical protein
MDAHSSECTQNLKVKTTSNRPDLELECWACRGWLRLMPDRRAMSMHNLKALKIRALMTEMAFKHLEPMKNERQRKLIIE